MSDYQPNEYLARRLETELEALIQQIYGAMMQGWRDEGKVVQHFATPKWDRKGNHTAEVLFSVTVPGPKQPRPFAALFKYEGRPGRNPSWRMTNDWND